MKNLHDTIMNILALIVIIGMPLFGILYFYDAPLDRDVKLLEAVEVVPEGDNALFFYARIFDLSIAEMSDPVVKELAKKPFNPPVNEPYCWQVDKAVAAHANCLDHDAARRMMSTYMPYLRHIDRLNGYLRFYQQDLTAETIGHDMVNLYRVRTGQIYELAQTSPDKAINMWIADLSFLKLALADRQTTLTKTILFISQGYYYELLPYLIDAHPELAKKYAIEIRRVLNMPGITMTKSAQSDYRAILTLSNTAGNLFFKPNDMRNEMAQAWRRAKDVTDHAVGRKDFADYINRTKDKKADPSLFNPIGKVMVPSYEYGLALLMEINYRSSLRSRLLDAFVVAKGKGVKAADMIQYISDEKLDGLVTWDASTKALGLSEFPDVKVAY